MTDGTWRDAWIAEVFRTPLITDTTRVGLLALAPEMDESGRVSVPRDVLSERLGRSPRKINERIKNGIEAGFLLRVARGQKNQSAVYQGTLSAPPGGLTETSVSETPGVPVEARVPNSQWAGFKHPEKNVSETPGVPVEESVSGTPGGPTETAPIYKERARALRAPDGHHSDEQDSSDSAGGVVVHLFEDKAITSLRSTKTPARERASELVPVSAFDEFWAAYPRRIAKGAAKKAWDKAIKAKADPAVIVAAAARYATDPRRAAADIKYTPHPATWLNAERWTDEPEPQQRPATFRSTTDERVAQAQALKALYADEPVRPRTIRGEITR